MRGIESLISRIDDSMALEIPAGACEKIQEAEKALGITFPPSYRAFLSLYGAMSVVDVTISGIPLICHATQVGAGGQKQLMRICVTCMSPEHALTSLC